MLLDDKLKALDAIHAKAFAGTSQGKALRLKVDAHADSGLQCSSARAAGCRRADAQPHHGYFARRQLDWQRFNEAHVKQSD